MGKVDFAGELKPKKIDRYLYTLDYTLDYGLDELLSQGVSGTFGLARFVQKRFSQSGPLKLRTKGGACTTFDFRDKEGHSLLARNFDYKDGPCIVVRTSPKNGYGSVSVAAMNVMLYGFGKKEDSNRRLLLAPYACMDGVNEKGLSIAVLEIKAKPTRQKGPGPVTTTVAIRAVLDRCANVEEAISFFSTHSMNDALGCSYHYQLLDSTGRTVVIEYVDNQMKVIEPSSDYCAGHCHVQNFFLSEGGDNRKGFGYTRKAIVEEAFSGSGGVMTSSEAMETLHGCNLCYRHRRGYMIRTLWSAVYDCNDCSMLLCSGMDYGKKHVFGLDRLFGE